MTILIKNVQLINGLGVPATRQDVFVSGSKISAIGNFPDKRADTIIDGQGAYLAPGFIDIHNDSDHYLTLFNNPSQENFLKQGVTTIIGGHCGSSLAPLLYGTLESLQKWGMATNVNIDWHSVKEFLDTLDRQKIGVNIGTLIGHSTVRRALIGEPLRALSKNEIAVLKKVCAQALEEGGFGISLGLEDIHNKNTPYGELKALGEVVQKSRKIYAVHLREYTGDLQQSILEAVKLTRDTNVRLLIEHLAPRTGYEREYESALDTIEKAAGQVHFETHPSSTRIIELYRLLPVWAQNGGLQLMQATIADPWMQKRVKRELPRLKARECVIAQAPGNDFLVGKTLSDLQELYEMSEQETLLQLMLITKLRATVFYNDINKELLKTFLLHPKSFIGSNAADIAPSQTPATLQSQNAIDTFTQFLELAEMQKCLPIETAVQKMTCAPARFLGIRNRGEIREGNWADLVVFRNGKVQYVLVNGHVAIQDGIYTGSAAGKVLTPSLNAPQIP